MVIAAHGRLARELVTVIWSMVASACLTLAVIYFLVWCRNRTAWAHLLFCRDGCLDERPTRSVNCR